MENFIVSARKYRPYTFVSVVGQEAITSTLQNSISTNHLAHAYLFCGPRGVGKTTCARIFAKTINCKDITKESEACNTCDSCTSFNESRSFNIHELDAASNNSVDDIRNLIDQVRVPPQVGKYSVYIIDEVHMLSAQAFNAFLKTLEEPPEHAVFILATTEKQKIIPTILSRCQIFDFNRIGIDDIIKYLEYVAKNENIDAEPEALTIIAQKADGAMRDALSIFDQLVSFGGNRITYNDTLENLNVLDCDYYFRLTDAFLQGRATESFLIFNEILNNGFDGHYFITGLNRHFRDLLVCKDPQTIQLMEVGAGIREKYKEISVRCSTGFLFDALNIAGNCDINYKGSSNQRLHVELALFSLCKIMGLSAEQETERIVKEPQQKEAEKEKKAEKAEPGKEAEGQEKKEEAIKKDTEKVEKKEVEKDVVPKKEVIKNNDIIDISGKTFSVKETLQASKARKKSEDKAEIKEEEPDVTEILDNKFTLEDLEEKWKEYADSIKGSKPRMFSTLLSQLPVLKENFFIEVKMNNTPQEKEFAREIKHELLNYLKRELQNTKIKIGTVITDKKTDKKPYTPEEKYQYLNKKNPKLDKLKQQFNLDFE